MNRTEIVLALAPVYRGIGFIVFDNGTTPLDWGVKETRVDKLATCKKRVSALLAIHRPSHVVLELTNALSCRRRRRIRELIADLAALSEEAGSTVARYDRAAVWTAFGFDPQVSKDTIAAAIAERLPELAHHLPKPRRLWESEKHSMAIFEAAGLALAHFHHAAGK